MEDPGQVDVDGPLPGRERHLPDGDLTLGDPGVIHEDVDPASPREGRDDHRLDARVVGDVHRDRERSRAGRVKAPRECLGGLEGHVRDHDPHVVATEALAHRGPERARGAGDDRDACAGRGWVVGIVLCHAMSSLQSRHTRRSSGK